jgi:acid stress chaperone HdeA
MRTLTSTVVVTVTVLLSGCSVSQVINTGGDTKCKDFAEQDDKHQTDEVTKMMRDRRATDQSGAEATPADISAMRSSVITYCQTVGRPDPDSKISEAPTPHS